MRILFFGDAQAEHLRRWTTYFSSLGHEVHLITWSLKVLEGFSPVVVHKVSKPLPGSGFLSRVINILILPLAVRKIVSEIGPDVIHSHSVGAYSWLPMLLRLHPCVVSPWGDDILIDIHRSFFEKYFTVKALRSADCVHCDGENTKTAIVAQGVSQSKITLVCFGVDVGRFKPAVKEEQLLRKYGLQGKKVVVSTRTLNPVHNVETLIRAIPLILKKCPDVIFLVVGSGREEQMLKGLVKELGVESDVIFTGRIEEDEMVSCLQAADIYVSTSLSESGLAASTAEAMACELPVVNTDTGDIRLWVKDNDGGYVVPVGSHVAVAERTIQLLQSPEMRMTFGKRNRKVIEERNNVYVEMRKIERIYLDLAKGAAA